MSLFIEVLQLLWLLTKSMFWAVVRTFVSPRRKSVRGEIVLITGTGSGIGRIMALEFAKLGATVVGWDVGEDANRQTAAMVSETGGQMYTYVCDVSKREVVAKVAEKVKADVGDVTILINNAGIVSGRQFLDCTDAMVMKTVDVNLMAHFWTIKAFLPAMLQRNHGHVVTIASFAGIVGVNGLADYCASKFANVGMTESLCLELLAAKKTGVYTTIVCPTLINTGMFHGCSNRFPKLIPVVEPQAAVDSIVQAVLTNQRILYVPRQLRITAALKSILPFDAAIALNKFFGASDFMSTFVGRRA